MNQKSADPNLVHLAVESKDTVKPAAGSKRANGVETGKSGHGVGIASGVVESRHVDAVDVDLGRQGGFIDGYRDVVPRTESDRASARLGRGAMCSIAGLELEAAVGCNEEAEPIRLGSRGGIAQDRL